MDRFWTANPDGCPPGYGQAASNGGYDCWNDFVPQGTGQALTAPVKSWTTQNWYDYARQHSFVPSGGGDKPATIDKGWPTWAVVATAGAGVGLAALILMLAMRKKPGRRRK